MVLVAMGQIEPLGLKLIPRSQGLEKVLVKKGHSTEGLLSVQVNGAKAEYYKCIAELRDEPGVYPPQGTSAVIDVATVVQSSSKAARSYEVGHTTLQWRRAGPFHCELSTPYKSLDPVFKCLKATEKVVAIVGLPYLTNLEAVPRGFALAAPGD